MGVQIYTPGLSPGCPHATAAQEMWGPGPWAGKCSHDTVWKVETLCPVTGHGPPWPGATVRTRAGACMRGPRLEPQAHHL